MLEIKWEGEKKRGSKRNILLFHLLFLHVP